MSNENIIYIGRKPVMNYVLAVLTNFNQGQMGKVTLQARGKSISTAVDTAEVTKNRFMPNLTSIVQIGTEKMSGLEGGTRNVSTMQIVLTDNNNNEKTASETNEDSVVEEMEISEKEETSDTTEVDDESPGEE
jgi:DNA-binding protein